MIQEGLTKVGFGDAAAVAGQPTGFSVGATLVIGIGAFAIGALAGYMIRESVTGDRAPARGYDEWEEED